MRLNFSECKMHGLLSRKVGGRLALIMGVMLMCACNTPEETAKNHLEKGRELLNKGELDKAILELKTSSQDNKKGETYYLMALVDEKNRNFKSMRENLLRTLELDPDMTDARVKLGKVNVQLGDYAKAVEQADIILGEHPQNNDAEIIKATVLLMQNKSAEAEKIIDAVRERDKNNIEALSLKANLYLQRNEIKNAMELLNFGLEVDPKNIPFRMARVKLNADAKNITAVTNDYEFLIKEYPESDDFKIRLSAVYSSTGKLSEAETLLQGIKAKSPSKIEARILLLEFYKAEIKDKLVNEYQQALGDRNVSQQSKIDLSKWMISNGYKTEAEQGFKQVADAEKDSLVGLTAQKLLGEIALNDKDYKSAKEIADSLVKKNSDFVGGNTLAAQVMLAQGNINDAIEFLKKAIWIKDVSGDIYYLLGTAYAQKNDLDSAEKNFKQSLDVNPANLGAVLFIYNGYVRDNKLEMARGVLEKALMIKPTQEQFLKALAELNIREKKWDDAEAVVQKLAVLTSDKILPAYLQANILQGREQFDQALKLYEKIVTAQPDQISALVNIVKAYEGLKMHDKALAYVENHHVKHPDNVGVVGLLVQMYSLDKNFTKAKQIIQDQIAKTPKIIPLYLDLAKVEQALHNNPELVKVVYEKGLEKNPDDFTLSMALAGINQQMGDNVNAKKILEGILVKRPDALDAINNLAVLEVESANAEEVAHGLTLAEKLVGIDSTNFKDTYAWALLRNGRTADALKLLEEIIVKDPKIPDYRYHLGVAHFNSGNNATAISELKQAISLAEKQQRKFAGYDNAKKLLQELDKSPKK